MAKIKLTYHSNYNGWSVDMDNMSDDEYEAVSEALSAVTHDNCDDDGYYGYGDGLTKRDTTAVRKVIRSHFGKDASPKIKFDTRST